MKFAVFDTETTGLPFHRKASLDLQPRIIEFAGIITDGSEILDRVEFIVNPGVDVDPIITEITGLTNDDLKKYPQWDHTHTQEIARYFRKADAVVAHNLPFDKSMVEFQGRRNNFFDLDSVYWPLVEICTVEQTFHQYGKYMKLQELYTLLVGEYKQEHRAMSDIMMLHAVCQKIGVYESFEVI